MTLREAMGTRLRLLVATTWDGAAVEAAQRVSVAVTVRADELIVEVDAPFHDDPPPPGAPGSTDALWDHEVVELMLLGRGESYLEIELSPHGHYLVLQLAGRRRIVDQGLPLHFLAQRDGARWRGTAHVPAAWLPEGCDRLNAYAIHGVGSRRRYLAWRPRRDPPADARPDFHHLESFGSLSDCDRVMLDSP